MNIELTLLGWTVVLGLVQILFAAGCRTKETGLPFNLGPRDEAGPPVGVLAGRARRAQANLFETLPLFAAAILIAHVGGREGSLTILGAWTYFLCRLAYLPLYVSGIPIIRSLVWGMSFAGLCLVLVSILAPSV